MLTARLRDILCAARQEARAQQINAEFHLHRERSGLVRLGNSSVALSTSEELTRLTITVQQGRKVGAYALTADLTTLDQVRAALARAQEFCSASPEMDYMPIFGAVEESVDDETGVDPALVSYSPQAKTALCAEVIETLKAEGDYDFSGSWSSGETEFYVISTANDREAYRRFSDGKLMLVLQHRTQKWELAIEQSGMRASEFSAAAAIADFQQTLPVYLAQAGYRTPLAPARVIFGPQAIAELCGLAVWSGFAGRGWEEGRTFTAGKPFGTHIFSPQVTLYDDPDSPRVFGMPFDLTGRRRRRFLLAENGVFQGLMYSASAAAKYGKPVTGHELENPDLVLATGDAPAGLSAGCALAGDALYIPFLHYVNMPDPSQGQFTGSSRFNALRVEGGACTAPLLSTRVTDSIPHVLSHVLAISSRAVSVNMSNTYGPRAPIAMSVPEYLICDHVRINDVAESF
jgi:predicted Zn-dependent protease